MIKKIYLVFLLILPILLMGCQRSDDDDLISLASYNSLVSLNDLSVEVSELLVHIEKKDYIKANEVIGKLHESWDSFYPYAYISGLKNKDASSFTIDLNKISTRIFEHSRKQKVKEVEFKAEKAKLLLQSDSKGSESNKEESGSANKDNDTWNSSATKKNDMEMMIENKLDYQNNSLINSKAFEEVDKIILPEEIMLYTYPELTFTTEDAQVFKSAVQLSKHIAGFYALVHEPSESSLLYIKYLFQDTLACAVLDDFNTIGQNIQIITAVWKETRLQTGKKNEELIIKIDQNLRELGQINATPNKDLVKIKCKIAIRNIEDLINR